MKNTLFYAIFATILSVVCSCSPNYASIGGYAQGGTWAVKYCTEGVKQSPEELQAAVDSILICIDTTLSGYNKLSMLSRFNSGSKITPNSIFKDIYARSYEFYELSQGALDVACGPLFDAWGFGFTGDSLPDTERLAKAKAASGMGRLLPPNDLPESFCSSELLKEPQNHSLPSPVLNFNAIAQGYSCDLVAEYLRSQGVKHMLVDIGEIWCEGLNPNGQGWSIGIDTPEDGNNSPGKSISGIWQSDGGAYGVVTSGNYRKFYFVDGKKYAHTLDPRSGMPVTHNLLSATVIAPSSTEADALATWFMVIGEEEAKTYIEAHDDIEACLITSEGIWKSAKFQH